MQFQDALTLDAPKITRDGFMAVRAKAARSGVYQYLGSEVGGSDHGFKASDTVRVYRPDDEVFDAKSVASFIAKPVTDNHPADSVTAQNWKDHARGAVMGAMRDGEYLAFDLVLMDAAIIDAVQSGKRELSNGYSCQLDWTPGTTPSGEAYDARQTSIIGNHVAVVDHGRAGSQCRIADANQGGGNAFALCDANPSAISGLMEKPKMKIMVDGLQVDLSDADAVKSVLAKKDAAIAEGVAALADAKAENVKLAALQVAKDAEIVALTAKLADSAITPDRLRDAAKVYADVSAKAKALGVAVTDAMGQSDIMKAVVDAKMGDAAKDYTADHVAIAFAALTKEVKATDTQIVPIGQIKATDAAQAERDAFNKANDLNAWRNKTKAA